jgi:hypothetical protein
MFLVCEMNEFGAAGIGRPGGTIPYWQVVVYFFVGNIAQNYCFLICNVQGVLKLTPKSLEVVSLIKMMF